MKNRLNPFLRSIKACSCLSAMRVVFAGSIAVLFTSQSAQATTYYWDNNTAATAGFGTATGTWGTSALWGTNSAGSGALANTTITTADEVNFGTALAGLGAGTITGPAVAQGFLNMTFGSASGAILLSGGTLNLAASSTITVNNASDTISSVLQGSGSILNKAGTGTLILSGTSIYTGATNVNAGTLQLSGTAGKITGTSGLTVNSGGTFIDGDTTTAANNNGISNRINSGTTLTLNGGSFQLAAAAAANTHTQTFNTLSFGAGFSTISTNAATGTNTLTFSAASGSNYNRAIGGLLNINTLAGFNVAFTNAITGAANVTGSGADAILFGATLNNTDFIAAAAGNVSAATYTTTGTTTWTAAKNMDVTGTNGAAYTAANVNSVRFNTSGSNTVTLSSGTNAIAGGILVTNNVGSGSSLITGGTITGAASSDLLVNQSNTGGGLEITSTIADNTTTALTKGGAGILTLSGTNTYSGRTTIGSGTLLFTKKASLYSGTTGSWTAANINVKNGGTLALNVDSAGTAGFDSASLNTLLANISVAGSEVAGLQSGAILGFDTTTATGGTFTQGNVIANSTGASGGAIGVTKLGSGILIFDKTNTYTGATAVNAGTLKLANATAINTTSGLTVASGATFDINGNNATIGLLSGSGTITNNAASGTTTVAATGGTWTGSITDGSNAKVALKLNSAVAMTLGGTNTFTGGLIIGDVSNTPLTVSSGAALGNGLVTVSNNSSLRLTNGQTITGKTVSIQGTGGGPSGGNGNGALNLISGTATWAGDVQSGVGTNGGRIGVTGAGTLTISGNISNNTGTSGTGLDVTFNADTTLGNGIVILSGTSNTYTGSTIVGRGVLKISDSNILPSTSILQVGTASNVGGRFDLNGYNQTVGGLQRTQAAAVEGTILNNGAADSTLTISTISGTSFSHNGVIKDGTTNKVSIIKSGAGSQTFTAANLYTGGTTINGGTLLLSGAFNMPATGTLQVNAGGTFSLADATARTTTTAKLGLASGANLAFDWNAGAVDTLTSTAAATTTGNVGIIINNTSPTGSGGTLISSASGGLTTANSTKYFLANNTNFTAGLTVTDTAVSIGAQTAVTANLLFWQGNKVLGTSTAGVDNALALSTGAVSNWSTAAGTYTATGVVPGSTADAIFSTTDTPSQQVVVLGADMTLKSVTFNDGVATTIGGSNILTLMSTVATAGTGTAGGGSAITVTSAAANPTISANVALGASQTWNVANGKTLLLSGAVSGASNLTKADTGTLTLSGANSFTGSTTISAGALNLSNQNALQNSTLTMGGGTLVFDQAVSGNAFTFGGLAAASAGTGYDIALLNNAGTPAAIALTVGGNNAATTYAGVLSGAGGSLIKTGTGTLTLSGANSISGGLTVTVGKIITDNNMTFGDVNLNGGTLSLGGGAASYTTNINGLTGSGTLMTGDSGGFARTLYLGNNNATADFSGIINKGSNRGLALYKTGSGTQTLSGSSANVDGLGTGSFTTTVQAGTLVLNKSGVVALPGASVGVSGGMLKLAGTGGNQISDTASVTLSGGKFDLNNLTETVGAVSITAPAASGDTIMAGNLTGSSYAASNTTGTAIVAANLLGSAGFTKSGAGDATLSGTNTYSGATLVKAGTLTLSGARTGSSGAITVADTAATNATLNIENGTIALGANNFIVGNAPTTAATATVTQSGGAVSFTSGNGLLLANAGVAGSSSIYNLSGGSITTFASTTRGIILGTNSDKGSSTFNLSGTGVLNMTAASGGGGDAILQIGRSDSAANNTTNLFSQTGGTANVGILAMGGKATIAPGNSSGVSSTLTLTGGTFTANQFTVMGAGNTNAIAINIGDTADVTLPAFPTITLGASSTATLSFDGGTLRPGTTSTNYLGSISSAIIEDGGAEFNVASAKDITITQDLLTHVTSTGGGLTKDGLGSLMLSSNSNTYTGATQVDAGKLVVNGNISTSSLTTVGSTATLSGIGTVGAATIDGTLAIGSSPGTMTFAGNLGLNTGSISDFEINSFTLGDFDLAKAAASGTQTVSFNGGTLNLLFQSGFNTNGTVKIFDFDVYSGSGFTSLVSTGLASGFTASFDATNGFVTVIPEPNVAALFGGLGVLALLRRRRA